MSEIAPPEFRPCANCREWLERPGVDGDHLCLGCDHNRSAIELLVSRLDVALSEVSARRRGGSAWERLGARNEETIAFIDAARHYFDGAIQTGSQGFLQAHNEALAARRKERGL